jgi:hypothetical protein
MNTCITAHNEVHPVPEASGSHGQTWGEKTTDLRTEAWSENDTNYNINNCLPTHFTEFVVENETPFDFELEELTLNNNPGESVAQGPTRKMDVPARTENGFFDHHSKRITEQGAHCPIKVLWKGVGTKVSAADPTPNDPTKTAKLPMYWNPSGDIQRDRIKIVITWDNDTGTFVYKRV